MVKPQLSLVTRWWTSIHLSLIPHVVSHEIPLHKFHSTYNCSWYQLMHTSTRTAGTHEKEKTLGTLTAQRAISHNNILKGKLHSNPSCLRSITISYNIFKTFHFHTLTTILFQNSTFVTFFIHWSVKCWRGCHIYAMWLPNVSHVAKKLNF